MSWLRIDDAFEDHPKVEPLSDSAHRLWMRAATWCRKATNAHTNGFVPRAMLRAIAKNSASQSKLEKLAQELVDARAGGMFEHGLWEPRDGGWQFHDWARYQPDDSPPMTRAGAARIAGLRSAEVRRERHGSAQPRSPERPPNEHRTFDNSFGSVRPNDVRRTEPERPEPPIPDPRSDLLTTTTQGSDRFSRENSSVGGRGGQDSSNPPEKIPCPKGLALSPGQRATLETAMIPGWAIDLLTTRFVANHQADLGDKRTRTVWLKCLSQAVSGWWNNANTRPKPPDNDSTGGYGKTEDWH